MQNLEQAQGATAIWQIITHLGSSSLVIPVVACVCLSLWQAGQMPALRRWLAALPTAAALTLATKIAFLGWGIGIAALDFTGISGHTLLATAVLPVALGWGFSMAGHRYSALTAAGGCLLAIAVGISRIALGTHSLSEVFAGWILGGGVAWLALRKLVPGRRRPLLARAAPLLLLFAFDSTAATYLPAHDLEIRISLLLSGRQAPFSRPRPPAAPSSHG